MRASRFARTCRGGALLLAGLASAGYGAAMPQAEFACKVRVPGGKIGLVLVQADSRALAEKSAVGAQAFTTDNMRSRATEVLQCIVPGEERFADYEFQHFFENLPL